MSTKYSCIYKITTTCSEKVYIGSANWFDRRVSAHINRLNLHTHPNPHLQAAWDKYGADTFTFECIEECASDKLIEREQYWIDFYNAANPQYGYNIAPFAGNTLGRRHSDATKEKIRQKAFGRKALSETKMRMSISRTGTNNPMYGKRHKKSSIEKMKYLASGELRSIAYSGSKNFFYGKKHTQKSKKKISQSRVGRRTRTVLTVNQVSEIKRLLQSKDQGTTYKALFAKLSATYGVSPSCIRKIYTGERWNDIQ